MRVPSFTASFVRYVLVGIATNSIGYLIYLLLTTAGLEPKVTMSMLYIFGAAIGYLGNRRWAFQHSGSIWRSSTGYFIFHLGGYLINLGLLYLFVDRLSYPHQVVQACAIIIVAAYLFTALRVIVFNDPKKDCQVRSSKK